MIVKILGIIDIFAAFLFWLSGMFHIIPSSIITAFAIIILAKGIIFLVGEHIASVIDVIVALVMLLSLSFPIPRIIVFLITFLLLQKGIFSLVA